MLPKQMYGNESYAVLLLIFLAYSILNSLFSGLNAHIVQWSRIPQMPNRSSSDVFLRSVVESRVKGFLEPLFK